MIGRPGRIIQLLQIRDQAGACRMPGEPGLGLGAGGPKIHTGEHRHPAEVILGLFKCEGLDRQAETLAEHFGDLAYWNAFLGDRIVPRTLLSLLQREPV